MSFLSFRHARRKAKKIVSARSLRPSTPPSPGSFTSTNVVEIGDPARVSPETYYPVVNPRVDIELAHEPLFHSDPFLATLPDQASTLNSTRLQDERTRSRIGTSSPIPPQEGAELVRGEDRNPVGYLAVESATRTPASRRAVKVTPSPIKIPPTSLASKVQIQRSAGKSAEPHPPSVHGISPVNDDSSSAMSSVSLPGVLIANVWTVQGDQAHHHRLSRRITRLDSATLPIEDYPLTNSSTQNGDGEPSLPSLPLLPASINGVSTSRPTSDGDRSNAAFGETSSEFQLLRVATTSLGIGKSYQISPITELPTPDASDLGTPDLITDSSISAKGGSQPDPSATPGSELSVWSGPASTTSPASGEEITMLLERLSSNPSRRNFAEGCEAPSTPNQASVPEREGNGDEARPLLTEQRRTVVRHHSSSHSRSGSRPYLSSLLLHPATLHIGERRVSSTRSASESPKYSQGMIPDEADRQLRLSSSLPTANSTFRQSVTRNSALPDPLRLLSPPPSPDLLDHIVLADESNLNRRERHASNASMSMVPGSEIGQTFPETPYIFSPMFSPDVDYPQGLTSSNSESSMMRQTSANRRLRRLTSQRFIAGRSASSRTSKARRKHKSKRSSAGIRTPATPPSLSTATNGGLFSRPRPVAGAHSLNTAHSQRPAHRRRSEFQRKTITPSAPLTLPPPPPSQPPSPQETETEPIFSPTSSSLLALLPSPPPPKLHLPPPPHSKAAAVSPLSPSRKRSSTPPTLIRPPSADSSSADDRQVAVFPPSSSRTPPRNPLASPSALLGHAPANHPLSTYNTDRPHRPLGPRAPYRNISSSPRKHARLLSSVSVDSTLVARDSLSGNPNATSGPVPTFRTSPPKFKGLTLEAAKWTFSSEELHAVVSDAIKWTGRASSIRLLSPQAAFDEIPKELERLEALLHELRVQYRLQVRKRDALLKATFAHVASPEFCSVPLFSKLQELQQTTASLDRIAEELYNTRDQAAQLSRMLAVHSSSALAMALRKLHASFLKKTAEVQTLKEYVSALEVERDEAWAQAQQVARDLDDLNDTLHAQEASTQNNSRRSSRVVASRKSSIRLSRGIRLSVTPPAPQTSQLGSARCSYVSASAGGLTPSLEIPVPPIPRRLSSLSHIITSGLPSRSSVRTSDLSLSSGRRALAQAQADLYGYLGIDDPELIPPPPGRSSFIAVSPQPTSPLAGKRLSGGPLSAPADRRMTWGDFSSDRLHASLQNSPDAMLATFNLLDD